MADRDLDELLRELRRELDEWEAGDRDPEQLRRLVDAVEDRLERAGGDRDRDDDDDDDGVLDEVVEEVNEAVVEFETEHPRLAGILRQIADTLGGVGL